MRVSVSVPSAITPGPSLWKLNLSVLNDPEYVSLITGFWSFWCKEFLGFLLWIVDGRRGSVKLGVCPWMQLVREWRGIFLRF